MALLAPVGSQLLVDRLTGAVRSAGWVILFGAGASNPAPSNLPFADPWKRMLLPLIGIRAGLTSAGWQSALASVGGDWHSSALGHQVNLLKLEALFGSCEAAAAGLGGELATSTAGVDEVNSLHRLVAESVANGVTRAVITTNWDHLLERAFLDAGVTPRVWVAGARGGFDPAANLYKLHGSDTDVSTLRHTFATVNRRFPPDVLNGLRTLCAGELVAIGYAGADYDVRDGLGPGGPVYWLHRDSLNTLAYPAMIERGASTVATFRDVIPVADGFEQLVRDAGKPWLGMGRPDVLRTPCERALNGLNAGAAAAILSEVLYRILVADPTAAVTVCGWTAADGSPVNDISTLDAAFVSWLAQHGPRPLYLAASAARAQHVGRKLTAATSFIRIAAHDRQLRWRHLSDAADSLELLGHGLIPIARPLVAPIHLMASRKAATNADDWASFRWSRGLASWGRHRRALAVIESAIARGNHDTYVDGQLLRRRALLLARLRRPGWQQDLATARELFDFEQRTLEIASLLRTEAVCVYLTAGPGAASDALLGQATALSSQRGNVRRNQALRWLMRRGRLGKWAIGLLLG